MDELQKAIINAGVVLIPLLVAVYGEILRRKLHDLKERAIQRDQVLADTREDVARLINGKGVRHDAERNAQALSDTYSTTEGLTKGGATNADSTTTS